MHSALFGALCISSPFGIVLAGWASLAPDMHLGNQSCELSPGGAAQMPNAGSKVRVRYTLRTADGDLVEERGEGNELEFVVDEGA